MKADRDLQVVIDAWPLIPWHVKARFGLMAARNLARAGDGRAAFELVWSFFGWPVLAGLALVVLLADLLIVSGVWHV
jgi:hypothetical protein